MGLGMTSLISIIISSESGHTSLQASRISWLSSGWFSSKSTGQEAKHMITALTELDMIPNKTLVRTRPTTKPVPKDTVPGSFNDKTCKPSSDDSA